ncbi:unnamed protein product [Rotaria sp. Silwood1]|nr:unnamed protein product [Rotaria sp. Silwood1]
MSSSPGYGSCSGKDYPTTSISCTNKINQWIYQGTDATLLNQLIILPIQLWGLIIQTNTNLSSVFKHISVIFVNKSSQYDPSSDRIRTCSMSVA